MELESEDGYAIFVPEGCQKEIGRGHGFLTTDRTVSRRQILIEVPKRCQESFSDNPEGRILVKVLGPNPVCIVQFQPSHETKFLMHGQTDTLFPGDKLSLSLRSPVFFTIKEGDENKKGKIRLGKEPSSSTRTPSNQTPCDEGFDVDDEEGLAQAIARRQRRARERLKEQENTCTEDLNGSLTEIAGASSSQFAENHTFDYNSLDTEGVDPVKEFGFLIEGSEFDQYKKKHFRIYPLSKSSNILSDDDQDSNTAAVKGKRNRKDSDDTEWRGEDQDEKIIIERVKKSKMHSKARLRSHNSPVSRKVSAAANKQNDSQRHRSFGVFIVDENEEEEICSEDDEEDVPNDDEDDSDDDDEMMEVYDTNEEDESNCYDAEKPLCKYGKNCYRKNKDHLAQFRH